MKRARRLLDIGKLTIGITLELTGDRKLETYVNGENYYNIEVLLKYHIHPGCSCHGRGDCG